MNPYFSFTPNAEMMDRSTTREKWHAERRDRFVKRRRVNVENDRTRFEKFREAYPSVPKMPCPVNTKWRKFPSAKMLTSYKEKGRIQPIVAPISAIAGNGYGNGFLASL